MGALLCSELMIFVNSKKKKKSSESKTKEECKATLSTRFTKGADDFLGSTDNQGGGLRGLEKEEPFLPLCLSFGHL